MRKATAEPLSLGQVLRLAGRNREIRALNRAADLDLTARLGTYRENPVLWMQERPKVFVTRQQRQVLQSVRDHRYTAVHSAHDLGKSFTAAGICCWWIDVHPPGEAFVVSTAPTYAQVRAILWREIQTMHARGQLPGRILTTEWKLGVGDTAQLVGFGRKPADTNPAAFQGIHARYVLVVIDEACGVPKVIFDAVDSLATNEEARVLAIGNPDDPSSHFAQICKPGSGWNAIHLDGLQSPNFTDEEVPNELRPMLLSQRWVEERRDRWGEGSALYVSKVRGMFPDDSDDGVVRYSKVAHCRTIPVPYTPNDDRLLPVELGVDVGAGGDFTSVRERTGMRAGRVWRHHGPDTMEVVSLVLSAIETTGATSVKVDANGIGKGVADRLAQLRREGTHTATIVPVNVGVSSTRPKRFPRLRDEMWWDIGRELSETGGWDLTSEHVDDDTIVQLTAPKYHLDAAGRTCVEQKDETRKRLGRSPDDADALLLAFYAGTGPEKFMRGVVQQHAPMTARTPETVLGMPTGPGPMQGVPPDPATALYSKGVREQLGMRDSEGDSGSV